jgi:SAM-dependent methyltransferase
MADPFTNVYDDDARARAYAGLEFPGTYYLAFRDLPGLLQRHVTGRSALDFGCGAGRSSRFLKGLGFEVTGVDVSAPMLAHARQRDPEGTYLLLPDGDLGSLTPGAFDLVFSAFTFDNVPGRELRAHLFRQLGGLLAPGGRMVNLVSAPEIYVNEWASFSTREFAENRTARGGDRVRIVMLDVEDRRPVEDVFWTDDDYRALVAEAGLEVVALHRPLGMASDPIEWVSETHTSPWAIYVLQGACIPVLTKTSDAAHASHRSPGRDWGPHPYTAAGPWNQV